MCATAIKSLKRTVNPCPGSPRASLGLSQLHRCPAYCTHQDHEAFGSWNAMLTLCTPKACSRRCASELALSLTMDFWHENMSCQGCTSRWTNITWKINLST